MRSHSLIGADDEDAVGGFGTDTSDREMTRSLTAAGLAQWSVPCSPQQLDQLTAFRDLLLEWNSERMNLTRLTSPAEIASEHFLDSASLLTVLTIPRASTLLDIGAGAGFPSLPLAILRPDLRVTLLEATAKKLAFCEAAAQTASLDARRLRFVHGRAEDERVRRQLAGKFDIVTARAVAPLVKLIPWCSPYLRHPGGILAALKGAMGADEMREAEEVLRTHRLSAQLSAVDIPGSDRAHTVILCRLDHHQQHQPDERRAAAV